MTRDPSRTREAPDLLAALDQRFSAAAAVLLGDGGSGRPDHPGEASGSLLPLLMDVCRDPARADARWLVLTAAFGAFPTMDQVKAFGRQLELATPERAESALLADVIVHSRRGRIDLPMTVVSHGTIVDVDFCARHETHTGIHRVVRETVPRWSTTHPVQAVAWIDGFSTFRTLGQRETARVFSFGRPSVTTTPAASAHGSRLVVPWHSVVVLSEIPDPRASKRLAAIGRYSGSTLSIIGYDMIPITSADMRPQIDANVFARYLTVVKYAHRLAAISRSTAAEFRGFAESLAAQGLAGPEIREIQLAGEALRVAVPRPPRHHGRPIMLCVGSHEPHKNQRAALHAAERLWREGLDFEVRLVGGPGWSNAVLRPAIEHLVAARRPIRVLGRVSDDRLVEEMQAASFVFFASLHEGYGLPVAEALACGTPVITADFGGQAEIAEHGGCVTVDPRDDDDVAAAVRRLLTEPRELERLRTEAVDRPVRTWDEYAEELWGFLVAEGRQA